MVEQGLHVEAEGFVVAVDGRPGLGWAASSWCADSVYQGRDDVVAGGEQRGDGVRRACGSWLSARIALREELIIGMIYRTAASVASDIRLEGRSWI